MEVLIQILITGIVVGCIYGMAALGFTIVYNATKLINFANGEFLMLGGVVLAGAVATAGLPGCGIGPARRCRNRSHGLGDAAPDPGECPPR